MPPWYPDFLDAVVAVIPTERPRNEWLLVNWSIGQEILRWQSRDGWANHVLDQLSIDLKTRFPTDRSLSPRNLREMRDFAEAWPYEAYARGPLSQLPWHHHLLLLHRLDDLNVRLWYARRAVEDTWTRATLLENLTTNLHRQK
ncbi:DUF1016 N-terminal domain-containing protein [Kribbella sp. NPDC056861]|uniref:DUF1016 N-terminal domain-containing protein n=1 Tax=Kribbella sp. NPDC056861 TaxID=3154857 RepID=UPI00344917A8